MSYTRVNSFDVGPVTFHEIEAWSRLYSVDLSPSEVFTITQLDLALRYPEQPEPRSIIAQMAEIVAHNNSKPRKAKKNG